MIDYNVISTGSKGNAVALNKNILIDAGVPFRALSAVYRGLQLVLLTHIHGDHFNQPTLRRLAQERPTLRFGCCEWLVAPLVKCGVDKGNIDVYKPDLLYNYEVFTVCPFRLVHDVPNCGYKLHFFEQGSVVYATDTNSMSHVDARGYDLYMLEANYNQAEIEQRIREKQVTGIFCHEYKVLKNHLSQEKAEKWLACQIEQNSRYVWLHQHEEPKCPIPSL